MKLVGVGGCVFGDGADILLGGHLTAFFHINGGQILIDCDILTMAYHHHFGAHNVENGGHFAIEHGACRGAGVHHNINAMVFDHNRGYIGMRVMPKIANLCTFHHRPRQSALIVDERVVECHLLRSQRHGGGGAWVGARVALAGSGSAAGARFALVGGGALGVGGSHFGGNGVFDGSFNVLPLRLLLFQFRRQLLRLFLQLLRILRLLPAIAFQLLDFRFFARKKPQLGLF